MSHYLEYLRDTMIALYFIIGLVEIIVSHSWVVFIPYWFDIYVWYYNFFLAYVDKKFSQWHLLRRPSLLHWKLAHLLTITVHKPKNLSLNSQFNSIDRKSIHVLVPRCFYYYSFKTYFEVGKKGTPPFVFSKLPWQFVKTKMLSWGTWYFLFLLF